MIKKMKNYLFLLIVIVLMVSGCGQSISFEEGKGKELADVYPDYQFSYNKDEKVVYLKYFTSVDINYNKKYDSADIINSKPSNMLDVVPFLQDINSDSEAGSKKKEIIETVEAVHDELSKDYEINDVICTVYNDIKETQGAYSYNNYWE